jgi:hypothetical protein
MSASRGQYRTPLRASELHAAGSVTIRFTVEERHLTDTEGKPITADDAVDFLTCEGESIDDAMRLYVRGRSAELIGDVLKFPGLQAVATIRKSDGVYTLQFTPASQQFKL